MPSIDFFCFRIPILSDPEPIEINGEVCKFWNIGGIVLRTRLENGVWSSLQERFNNFLRKESGGGMGYSLINPPKEIIPANKKQIEEWVQSHIWIKHHDRQ